MFKKNGPMQYIHLRSPKKNAASKWWYFWGGNGRPWIKEKTIEHLRPGFRHFCDTSRNVRRHPPRYDESRNWIFRI